ncbi:unnamed protein product [Citrullus colocynthis]|uniref:Uncharacterized protein n=1 Tax=Citrullus colocynthis TaxID=252529 RepID=A0ABP0YEL8_9ROSI
MIAAEFLEDQPLGELASLWGEIGQLRAAIEDHSLMMLNQNLEQSESELEERMDIPRGLIVVELLRDQPLPPHTHMHLLASDLDARLANMDAAVEGLGKDVQAHQGKAGVRQDVQAQGLEQGIEVIQVDSDSDDDDMSVCSNQVGVDERSMPSTDHHPRDCPNAAIWVQMDLRGPLF